MFVNVVNPQTNRRTRMEARTLAKVLHMATFHGWHPERINWQAPTASWDTTIVMPYVTPYLSGVVSESDAAGLVNALKKVIASEGSGLVSELYLSVLMIKAIAEGGSFELRPEPVPDEKKTKSVPAFPAGVA